MEGFHFHTQNNEWSREIISFDTIITQLWFIINPFEIVSSQYLFSLSAAQGLDSGRRSCLAPTAAATAARDGRGPARVGTLVHLIGHELLQSLKNLLSLSVFDLSVSLNYQSCRESRDLRCCCAES